ncbi:HopJ type III effector protein [Aliikangiella maris]|uniref:HopJ type III effector protein n=2 Tax=Aliikangiella maris TaxID=3162458 RepID=A0ABV2BVH8_9GAMM
MKPQKLIEKIIVQPKIIEFSEVIQCIDEYYLYEPSTFINNGLENIAGTNEGSCKIFAFASLNNLNEKQTLACFGHYYREDVLNNPEATDHQNIRNFMQSGWKGIQFEKNALTLKTLIE